MIGMVSNHTSVSRVHWSWTESWVYQTSFYQMCCAIMISWRGVNPSVPLPFSSDLTLSPHEMPRFTASLQRGITSSRTMIIVTRFQDLMPGFFRFFISNEIRVSWNANDHPVSYAGISNSCLPFNSFCSSSRCYAVDRLPDKEQCNKCLGQFLRQLLYCEHLCNGTLLVSSVFISLEVCTIDRIPYCI